MRSHHPRWSARFWTLGLLTMALLSVPGLAHAQLTIDPTATPVRNDGGWVYWMAEGAIALGGLVLLLAGAAYLRFAPRFFRDAREAEAKGPVMAPPASSVRIQYTPPATPAPEPVGAGVGGGGAAAPLPSPSPTPLRDAPAAASAPAPAPAAAAPAQAAPAAAPRPPAPRHEGPVELDQETHDRVLKEQLDKGTDRRVAEGRARAAALKAAREKAGG